MNVEIANKLVKLRKQLGLSQEELAEQIGVSRQAVSKWERSESSPDTDNLIALSKIYKISIDEMLDYDVDTTFTDKDQNNNSDNYTYSDDVENTDESERYETQEGKKKSNFKGFPVPILATIIFLFLGLVFNLWHPGWIVFLAIPLFHFITSPPKRGSGWKNLPYPILCTMIFLLIGFLFNGWYYSWLIFLTIPIWAYIINK